MLCQYRRFIPDEEEPHEIVESDAETRVGRRPSRAISFKDLIDFYDKKEAEIKDMLKRNNRQTNRQLNEHSSSPS